MNALQIAEQIENSKGRGVRVAWFSQVQTLKGVEADVRKHSVATLLSGISYANRGFIKQGIEAGERGEVESLPWGQWRKGYENVIIDHEKDGEKREYVRFYPLSDAQVAAGFGASQETYFTINGVRASREEAIALCGSKAKEREHGQTACFPIRAENIVSIG